MSVSTGGSRLRKLNIRRSIVLKRPLNIRCRSGRQFRYGIAIDRCIVSRPNRHKDRFSPCGHLSIRGTRPSLLTNLQPRNSRRTRSAVVREQTGYRAAAYPWVPGAPNNCKNTRTRDLQSVLAYIKDHFSPLPPILLPFTALDDHRGWRRARKTEMGVDESAGTPRRRLRGCNWKKRAMCTY